VSNSAAADEVSETDLKCRLKFEIPGGMGFAAHFLDTEKNVMGIWSMH
jgi:hypothetical protein